MGLLRRNKSTEVQVRRAGEPQQEVIDIPRPVAGMGQPAASPSPNVTQNVVYISAPPAAAQAPPAAESPREVHHHTTVHHVSRLIAPVRGLSFFGVAGLVFGGLACAALYVPGAENFAKPLALAGIVAAGLGLLSAILFSRSGRGVPFLGLLISGAAYVIWFQHSGGQLQAQMQKLQQQLPAQIPKVDLGQIERKIEAIPAKVNPAAPIATPPVVVAAPAPAPVPATDLESLREAAAEQMGLDYKSAKAKAVKTRSDVVQLRTTAEPGSPELIAVATKAADADSELKEMQQKLRADPAVAAAERSAVPPKPAGLSH